MASGSNQAAQDIASDSWLLQRDWLIDELMQMHTRKSSDKRGSVRRILATADKLAQHPKQLANLIGVIKSWLRDLAVLPLTPERVINQDKMGQMEKITSSVPARTFISGFEALEKLEKQIKANANPRLALETYLINLTKDIFTQGGFESVKDYGKNRRYPV
jgi:hypothetical protein